MSVRLAMRVKIAKKNLVQMHVRKMAFVYRTQYVAAFRVFLAPAVIFRVPKISHPVKMGSGSANQTVVFAMMIIPEKTVRRSKHLLWQRCPNVTRCVKMGGVVISTTENGPVNVPKNFMGTFVTRKKNFCAMMAAITITMD